MTARSYSSRGETRGHRPRLQKSPTCECRAECGAVDLDAFDIDSGNPLSVGDVVERIGFQHQEVGFFAWRERAHLVEGQILRRAAGGRHNDLHRRHAGEDHTFKFALLGHTEEMIFETRITAKNDSSVRLGESGETALEYGVLGPCALNGSRIATLVGFPHT